VSGADHGYVGWYKLGEAAPSWLALCSEAAGEVVDVVPASRPDAGRPTP
jgi:hypothetical protein